MIDKETNSAPVEGAPVGGEVNVADIAARHPAGAPVSGKKGRRYRMADGTLVDRDSPEASADKAAREGKSSGVETPVQSNTLSPLVREQVLNAVKSLIKVIDGRVQIMVRKTALKITKDEGFSKQVADDVAMQEIESDTITTLTVIVLDKYNVLGSYAPEALLACAVVGYGWRVHSTLADLKQIAREMQSTNELPAQTPKADSDRSQRDG